MVQMPSNFFFFGAEIAKKIWVLTFYANSRTEGADFHGQHFVLLPFSTLVVRLACCPPVLETTQEILSDS